MLQPRTLIASLVALDLTLAIFGFFLLGVASPGNAFLGWYLVRAYKSELRETN